MEPGVAHEGRLLEPLRCDEGGGRGARAGGDRLECPSFRAREAVRRRGQLLEQPAESGGGRLGAAPCPAVAHSASASAPEPARRPRRAWPRRAPPMSPGGGRARASRSLARRGQLAQTGERRLAGEGADDDQLGSSGSARRGPARARRGAGAGRRRRAPNRKASSKTIAPAAKRRERLGLDSGFHQFFRPIDSARRGSLTG